MSVDSQGSLGAADPPDLDHSPIDLVRLNAEINAEVRRRRASGDFPPGLERELDTLFAHYAPAGAGGNFDEVMERAEQASFVHADVPTASNRPALAYVKRALRSVMAFYLRFLAQEVTAFAGAITRAVRLLGQRVEALETVTARASGRALAEVAEHRSGADLSPWQAIVTSALAGVDGRVLHTECGQGELVGHLVAAGKDAYGVEPSERRAMAGARAGLDVRIDETLTHLRALPDNTLGGLVLTGQVDHLPLGEVLALADLAAVKLSSRGVVVIVSSAPAAWSISLDPITADLSPGRPLHPETWLHLLEARGFASAVVHSGSPDEPNPARLESVPAATRSADILNANIDRLNRLLFAPASYAVTANRGI
jgi:hypothetical protein